MADLVPYQTDRKSRVGPAANGDAAYLEDYPEPATQTRGLRDYLAILRRQWWVFLGITLLFAGVTVYRTSKLPTRYQASGSVRLADRREVVVNEPTSRSMVGRETDPLASQIELLMSRSVATLAVELKGLRLVPPAGEPFPEQIDSIKVAAETTADSLRLTFGAASVVATSGAERLREPPQRPRDEPAGDDHVDERVGRKLPEAEEEE